MDSTESQNRGVARRLLILAATTAALLTVTSGARADAAIYYVIGTGGTLHVRTAPTLSAPIVGELRDGTPIDIVCQTRGDNVVASTMWDKIDQPTVGYVADWYTTTPVVNGPSPGLPACGVSPPPPPPPPPTNAGGQQITIVGPSQQSARVCGANQYNQNVCRSINMPGYGSTAMPNWWWHGVVSIANYADLGSGLYLGTTYCNVPAQGSGWYTCYGMPKRGNETKYNKYWWGLRIWESHINAVKVWQSVAATGNFGILSYLPNFGPISQELKYVGCAGQFVNALRSDDVGYGIVMDVNYWAPVDTCGGLKVWGQ